MTAPRALGNTNMTDYAFDGTLAVAVNDLMYHTGNDAKPASSQTDQGSEVLNQRLFARNFAGVSADARAVTNTNTSTNFPVLNVWTGVMDCPSSTWEVGDLVAVDEASSGTALENQKLVKVTDPSLAIGKCISREASATTRVRVRLDTRVMAAPIPDDGSLIWVSTTGTDDGDGSFHSPYLTIAAAFAVVTSSRKTVILMPGRYTSAASIAWPVGVTDVLLTGLGSADYESTEIHASAGAQVLNIVPNATIGAANYLCFLSNLTVSGDDGVNGVQITDAAMTAGKKLIVTFRDCGFSNDTDTDKSVVTTHTVASLIKIYMHGRGFGGNNIEGLVFIDCFNAGDRFKANGMNFEGGVQFSTDTVACENEFYACVMKLNGGSGGQDTQQLRANGCISRDGMTQAAAALGEFADNADEAFLSFT